MIRSAPSRRHDRGGATATGWLFSLLLHSGLIVGSLLFAQHMTLPPPSDLFTWNVAMVSEQTMAPAISSPISPASSPTSVAEIPPPPAQAMALTPLVAPPINKQHELATPSHNLTASVHPEPEKRQAEEVGHSLESPASASTPKAMAESATAATAQVQPRTESDVAAPSREQVSTQGTETAALAATATATIPRPDYGWLSEMIVRRVEALKRYPQDARLEQAQGKVIIKLMIKEDGTIGATEVVKSSGFRSLDQAALDLIRRAAPFPLTHPLGKPSMMVRIPISYAFDQP